MTYTVTPGTEKAASAAAFGRELAKALDLPEREARLLLEDLERLSNDADCHGYASQPASVSPIRRLVDALQVALAPEVLNAHD